jgi:hypothetical protein
MAIQFPDLNPTATSNDKDVHQKTVRLTFADFATGGTASVKAVLPADSTILAISIWNKTQLAGGGITAATLGIGTPTTPTLFVGGTGAAFAAANTFVFVPSLSSIMQPYQIPVGPDIPLLFTGTATTGNPTSGEQYVTVWYVR